MFYSIPYLFLLCAFKGVIALRAQQAPCYEFLCGDQASQLCGSDNVTYLNGCTYSQAQCKNPSLFVLHPGECNNWDQSIGSTTQTPVASSSSSSVVIPPDSTTPQWTSTTPDDVINLTPSPEECADPFCPINYKPVCGSDGITYSNICQFKQTQCRNPGLTLKHTGRCKKHENCLTRICPMRESSVCGSDSKTYRNICELSVAKCYNPELTPAGNGPCDENDAAASCARECNDHYRPVCATDGVTYPNVCHFEIAKCKNNKLKIYKFEPC